MNGLCKRVFHQPVQSSFTLTVNTMWKLCNAGKKSGGLVNYTAASATLGTDF
jgi:hypothetical protein